ncbi:MAG: hypothetical protein MUO26_00655 [Methanotrichaceae archaeon]|nr:hypothetical protein [Methanotrichaceae archaeon]
MKHGIEEYIDLVKWQEGLDRSTTKREPMRSKINVAKAKLCGFVPYYVSINRQAPLILAVSLNMVQNT